MSNIEKKEEDKSSLGSPDFQELAKQFAVTVPKIIEKTSTYVDAGVRMTEVIKPIIERQNEIFRQISKAIATYQEAIGKIEIKIPSIKIPESFLKLAKDVRYLRFLESVQWPLFLEEDELLRDSLSKYYDEESYPLDEIRDIIIDYYTGDKIDIIRMSWAELLKEDIDRLAILQEAVLLHEKEYYYGSTALLMSQVYGLITKMDGELRKSGYEVDERAIRAVCDHYKVKYDDWKQRGAKHERGQLLRLMAVIDGGFLYWDAVTKYIRNIILKSNAEDQTTFHNPMRHKILHGVQLNYGTKEHSLKAILTIDLLLSYYNEINYILTRE